MVEVRKVIVLVEAVVVMVDGRRGSRVCVHRGRCMRGMPSYVAMFTNYRILQGKRRREAKGGKKKLEGQSQDTMTGYGLDGVRRDWPGRWPGPRCWLDGVRGLGRGLPTDVVVF